MAATENLQGILQGAIDLHLHTAPSIFPRALNDVEAARGAKEWRLAAFVSKAHEGSTAGRAQDANFAAPDGHAVGSIVLNRFVGGLNPHAVAVALALGARVVFLPTIHAANHVAFYGMPGFPHMAANLPPRQVAGVAVLDESGTVLPDLMEIIDAVKEAGAVLATGHIGPAETEKVVAAARERGLERVLVNHPDFGPTAMDQEFQAGLMARGAYVEFPINLLSREGAGVSPDALLARLRRLGTERFVLSSDLGQKKNGDPFLGLARGVAELLRAGLSQGELDRILRYNPLDLLSGG
ncbi:MAG: DUF6282 family protein [Chloroflexi bacterium]|nr:DUF6282 family protein [Chloroflexota bacterium]